MCIETIVVALMFIIFTSLSQLPPSPPQFSWDTIPLFMHAQNESGSLNETAAKHMSTFPLTTIAKSQGQNNNDPVCSTTN